MNSFNVFALALGLWAFHSQAADSVQGISLDVVAPQAWAYSCERGQQLMVEMPLCLSFVYIKGPYLNSRGERQFSEGVARFHSAVSAEGALLSPEQVAELVSEPRFYLWMKMPREVEHGARPIAVEKISGSEFLITEMLMGKMPGQWFLRVQLDPSQSNDHVSQANDYSGEVPLTEWMSSM